MLRTAAPPPRLQSLFLSLRPSQWTKNLIVFAALLFGGLELQRRGDPLPAAVAAVVAAFVIFCLLSSAIYLLNDIRDRELERGIDFAATSGVDAAAIRFETAKVRPELAVDLFGGQRYNLPGGGYCSVGFNARNSAGTRFYLTAGHCGRVGTLTTLTSGAGLGVFDGSVFPSRDWAVVRITNSTVVQRGRVVNYAGGSILVSGSTPASIGASICRSGARTGYRCGTVRATNVTVNYSAGAVTGLTETTACIGQGDSGGSYITPSGQAQGVASGGRLSVPPGENCTTGGTPISWHQPVRPILSNYGLTLLLGP